MGGESLRSLTEKLRAVSHTLVMGIQGRWRLNNYDGSSTTRLTAGVLQVVVELITSAKGLFTLLNRLGREGYLTVTYAPLEESILFCSGAFFLKKKNNQKNRFAAVSQKWPRLPQDLCKKCKRRLPVILTLPLILFITSVDVNQRAHRRQIPPTCARTHRNHIIPVVPGISFSS